MQELPLALTLSRTAVIGCFPPYRRTVMGVHRRGEEARGASSTESWRFTPPPVSGLGDLTVRADSHLSASGDDSARGMAVGHDDEAAEALRRGSVALPRQYWLMVRPGHVQVGAMQVHIRIYVENPD